MTRKFNEKLFKKVPLDVRLGIDRNTLSEESRATLNKYVDLLAREGLLDDLISAVADFEYYEELLPENISESEALKILKNKKIDTDDLADAIFEVTEYDGDEHFSEDLSVEDRIVLYEAKDTEEILGIMVDEVDEDEQRKVVSALRSKGYKIERLNEEDGVEPYDVLSDLGKKLKAEDLVHALKGRFW